MEERIHDLLVIGAGPTGIGLGAEGVRAGLDVVLLERGALTESLLGFPTFMRFFTTRDRLEIGGVPFAVPDEKPDRRQALAYYRAVVGSLGIDVRTGEAVTAIEPGPDSITVRSRTDGGEIVRRARAVAVATGYFDHPRRLGVPGEDLPWVHRRYDDPYRHFDCDVVVVGGGNGAAEAALEMWRAGVRVTIVHRGKALKDSLKYWVKPDIENRISEGSIAAHFESVVTGFADGQVSLTGPLGETSIAASAAYILIGYEPDTRLLVGAGVSVDTETSVPRFDPETCETDVPGLYVAGAVQSGRDTNRIFIDNSRDHGERIVRAVVAAQAR